MNLADYDALCSGLLDTAYQIETAKRPGYTVCSPDVLANFKRVADRAGVTPKQAWAVYFLKHIDAITTAAVRPDAPQAEAMVGRFADAVNYLKLGWALFNEDA